MPRMIRTRTQFRVEVIQRGKRWIESTTITFSNEGDVKAYLDTAYGNDKRTRMNDRNGEQVGWMYRHRDERHIVRVTEVESITRVIGSRKQRRTNNRPTTTRERPNDGT